MNEQRPFDPQEAIENAQKLDMLRLQNEQTNLLRQMASGTNNASTELWGLDKKLGLRKADDPAEWDRRYKEWKKNENKKATKFISIFFASLGFLVLLMVLFV
jgi:hypothetical protein